MNPISIECEGYHLYLIKFSNQAPKIKSYPLDIQLCNMQQNLVWHLYLFFNSANVVKVKISKISQFFYKFNECPHDVVSFILF